MKRTLIAILLVMVCEFAFAVTPKIRLEKITPDIYNRESIKRGAKFFAANCMVCHSMVYLRYNKLAQKEGVLYDKMPLNVKEWPLGIAPPDLSLVIDYRGADWVYTYLHSFYVDTTRPLGVNNLLIQNTAMAGILAPYQGQQVLIPKDQLSLKLLQGEPHWYDLLELKMPGTMKPAEFDHTMMDVINFLTYAAEPYQREQHYLGYWVIGFLFIFLMVAIFLKKEYWKDVHKK